MSESEKNKRTDADSELEREIREGRKFTLEEAVGRMVGAGGMKGESPVARLQQAQIEIGSWLRTHMPDAGGALEIVLHRHVKRSEILLKNFDQPLAALATCCKQILDSDYLLQELVRDSDVQWGRLMDERPYFEKEGTPASPDDPYTVASVRKSLSDLLAQLAEAPATDGKESQMDDKMRQ